MKIIILSAVISLAVSNALAWDYRGHSTVCEAASFLVKNHQLKKFLSHRPQAMGHLCNIPDISWKGLGPDINKIGSPAHYVDPEILGLTVKDVPTNYSEIIAKYNGQKNAFADGKIYSIPNEFGSNWWRADQFHRLAVSSGNLSKNSAPPEKKDEQNNEYTFNKAIYGFYVNLGIMGHFVGDNAQPFHVTADYDGYKVGHGGIHSFYEHEMVSVQPVQLLAWVVERGEKIQNQPNIQEKAMLNAKSVVEKMKKLAELSFSEISKILKLDTVLKPSISKEEKGMKIKTQAVRQTPESQAAAFKPLIVTHMARGAVLLAQLWDQAYLEAGSPNLEAYKSYRFPFEPAFVAPDYFDLKLAEPKK